MAKFEMSDRIFCRADIFDTPLCGYYEDIPTGRRVLAFLKTGRWQSRRYIPGLLDTIIERHGWRA